MVLAGPAHPTVLWAFTCFISPVSSRLPALVTASWGRTESGAAWLGVGTQGWGSAAEPVALPAVPGLQLVCAGDEGARALLVCWPCSHTVAGSFPGVPPPVPTALPVLLQSPRAVCRGVLGGADRLLPLEMWLWFTGELRSQPKGSESGVTAQLLPTEVCISASGAHGVGKPCPRPGSAVPAAIERRW